MYVFLEQCLRGPNLPATVMLLVIIVYGFFVLLGALDLELFDVDLDIDVDADMSLTSIGLVALRFLNIGNVPVMIWASVFGIAWWGTSMLFWTMMDQASYEEGWQLLTQLLIRNLAIALVIAKLGTQPLVKVFERHEQRDAEKLIGEICIVETTEATDEFGQAKFHTDGAPLLLDIRTKKEPLVKGESAVIVDYDRDKRIYVVKKANREVQP